MRQERVCSVFSTPDDPERSSEKALCLKAATGLGVCQQGAGKAEGQTPGPGGEVLQSSGGAAQSLDPREGTAHPGESDRTAQVKEKKTSRGVQLWF